MNNQLPPQYQYYPQQRQNNSWPWIFLIVVIVGFFFYLYQTDKIDVKNPGITVENNVKIDTDQQVEQYLEDGDNNYENVSDWHQAYPTNYGSADVSNQEKRSVKNEQATPIPVP